MEEYKSDAKGEIEDEFYLEEITQTPDQLSADIDEEREKFDELKNNLAYKSKYSKVSFLDIIERRRNQKT